ncbi:MAG: hypothetical protein VYB27_00880 [Candidatus Thermoplasmatota archaeon]|nr:hypothetical protein [Candidatus Thermoplasmatota archaeon]
MTRPMGRIVAFAPETNGWDGPVGQLARKMGQLGNDVWWIHRDGNDFPINEFQNKNNCEIDRGIFDWRGLLNGARWLITAGPTLISSDDEIASWSAALTFAELEGTLNALILSSSEENFTEIWSKLVPRIRQFHIIGLVSSEIEWISNYEEWNIPQNKIELIDTLNRVQHKTLVPHLLARETKNGGWGVNSHTYGISQTDTTKDLEMGEWIGSFLNGLIKFGHGEEATERALRESNK